MRCSELIQRVERLDPQATPEEIARICLLVSSHAGKLEELSSDNRLESAWNDAGLRLKAAADQHAAMAEELEILATSDPAEFHQEQIWILVRALKVQSQILQCFLGYTSIDI